MIAISKAEATLSDGGEERNGIVGIVAEMGGIVGNGVGGNGGSVTFGAEGMEGNIGFSRFGKLGRVGNGSIVALSRDAWRECGHWLALLLFKEVAELPCSFGILTNIIP